MDNFSALFKQVGSNFSLSQPTSRANECEYEFQSAFKLTELSDFHGAIPDFQRVSGCDDRFRCDAVPAIRFVMDSKFDLLEAAYAVLPTEIREKLPLSMLSDRLPPALYASKESLLRNLSEPFGLKDLLAIKSVEAKCVLAKFVVYCLSLHITSREILLKSDSPLATMRLMEGSRVGDVVKSMVHGQVCMSVITDIEQDYSGGGGVYVNISTATLGAAVGRQSKLLAWQVRSNVLPMRRRTKAAGLCLPVTPKEFAEQTEKAKSSCDLLLQALTSPKSVQLRDNAVLIQKRPRNPESDIPVSGRAILDFKGFMLNGSSHGQDLAFHETGDEFFESMDVGEIAALLAAYGGCLSPSIPAYCLRSRKWGFVPFALCEEVQYRSGLMDKLVIDEAVKQLLLSLTNSFTKRSDSAASDFIDGKAGGNVFLLHGPSGIGKTLTAEATAESLKRPLYRVAAADLGTSPEEINMNLERVLQNSERWGAVTLLDEADIFLEARTSDNIERNAIVGIFLQTLEYSNGVLFVTTNRVHNLDEAILPRISLGFSYPELTVTARTSVWENILSLHKHNVLPEQIASLANFPFNGRQIKNVVNLAATTARSEGQALQLKHIQPMALATHEFISSCNQGKAAVKDGKARIAA